MSQLSKLILISILALLLVSTASAATLKVPSQYKTIQKAVNAASDSDTIQVASGTYHEYVKITKGDIKIIGTKYPKVDGFEYCGGWGTINGFSIYKNGVNSNFAGGGLIRNNYFYNCGISLNGGQGHADIINNQITGGTISVGDMALPLIKGTTISNSKCGIFIEQDAGYPTVTGCTFKNCKYGVYFYGFEESPGRLPTFYGNKYIKNKVNIGWGIKAIPL